MGVINTRKMGIGRPTGFTNGQQAALYYARKRRRAAYQALLDPFFEDVAFLSHFDSVGAVTGKDQSFYGHQFTLEGVDTAITAAAAKFGPSGLYLNGISDYVRVPGNDVFSLGQNFTLEAWINPGAAEFAGNGVLMSNWDINGDKRGWSLDYDVTLNAWVFWYSTNGVNFFTANFDLDVDGNAGGPGDMFDGNWHHIAMLRDNGRLIVCFDGHPGAGQDASNSPIFPNPTIDFIIGGQAFAAGIIYPFGGYVDEVRITVDRCRYDTVNGTKSFAVPTKAFPDQLGGGV